SRGIPSDGYSLCLPILTVRAACRDEKRGGEPQVTVAPGQAALPNGLTLRHHRRGHRSAAGADLLWEAPPATPFHKRTCPVGANAPFDRLAQEHPNRGNAVGDTKVVVTGWRNLSLPRRQKVWRRPPADSAGCGFARPLQKIDDQLQRLLRTRVRPALKRIE